MAHTPLRIALAVVVMAGGALGLLAQSSAAGPTAESQGLQVRKLSPKPQVAIFPLNGRTERRQALEFRSPEQMTAADRELAEADQGEIARRAGLQGFDLGREGHGGESWGYEQAVCPAFPEHVILEYSRDNGYGDVSLFSAVLPRGDGHVRVIPGRRRSYSLWTPVSTNALTINDFNHMVEEGHEGLNPDWLTLGLCYAALAGGHVRAALVPRSAAEVIYPLVAPAMLTVEKKGGAEVRFADATPKTKAMDWVLSFDVKGRLMKVRHVGSSELVRKPVAGAPMEVTGLQVKGTMDVGKPGN
jgi:hypothetical protein